MNYLVYTTLLVLLSSALPTFGQTPQEEVQEILEKLNAGEAVENMVINLGDINFQFGTAELEPRAMDYLNQVVSLMQKASNIELYIQGFTDNVGDEEFNKALSYDRAHSVQAYLETEGIDSNRLISEGFGSNKPIASNSTSAGRSSKPASRNGGN